MAAQGQPDNGTLLARIDERLQALAKRVDEYHNRNQRAFDELGKSLGEVKEEVQALRAMQSEMNTLHAACAARQDTRWENHGEEHQDLRRKSNIADSVTGGMGGLALVLTALKEFFLP